MNEEYSMEYKVLLNDVPIGHLSAGEYLGMSDKAWRDPRVYIQQIFNLFFTANVHLNWLIKTVPVFAFWGILFSFFMDAPATQSFLMALIQNEGATLDAIIHIGVCIVLLSKMTEVVLYGRLQGFENKFSADVRRQVRVALKAPADGSLELIPKIQCVASPS